MLLIAVHIFIILVAYLPLLFVVVCIIIVVVPGCGLIELCYEG